MSTRYELIAALEKQLDAVIAQLKMAEREFLSAPFESLQQQAAEDRVYTLIEEERNLKMELEAQKLREFQPLLAAS